MMRKSVAKVKEISSITGEPTKLEDKVNLWLEQNQGIEIMDIKYHTQAVESGGELYGESSVLIIYMEESPNA